MAGKRRVLQVSKPGARNHLNLSRDKKKTITSSKSTDLTINNHCYSTGTRNGRSVNYFQIHCSLTGSYMRYSATMITELSDAC